MVLGASACSYRCLSVNFRKYLVKRGLSCFLLRCGHGAVPELPGAAAPSGDNKAAPAGPGCRRDPWDPHTPCPSCSPSIIHQASAPKMLFCWSLQAGRCRAAGPSPARTAPRHAARCLAPWHRGNFCGLLLLLTAST